MTAPGRTSSRGRSRRPTAPTAAIESYSEIIAWLGSDDPTTRRMLEEILATEEEHADDLPSILEDFGG